MSTSEQDEILGRLIRESRECQRASAALEAKLSSLSSAIEKVQSSLSNLYRIVPIEQALKTVEMMPDKQTILEALQELELLRVRNAELKRQIDAMDV